MRASRDRIPELCRIRPHRRSKKGKTMQFYRKLYVSPEIKHPGQAKWRLRHGAGSFALYVITLCDESLSHEGAPSHGVSSQLQFFHCAVLQQDYTRKHCPMVIGIAEGRIQALELVRRIVQDCLDETGRVELVPFLAEHDARIHFDPGRKEEQL